MKHVIFQVKAEELTLGDIVEIKFGDRYVPYLFFQSPFFNIVTALISSKLLQNGEHFTILEVQYLTLWVLRENKSKVSS